MYFFFRSTAQLIRASMPMDETKPLQQVLVTKVLAAVRQRWHPLFFDPTLLSAHTIKVFMCLG